jgi:hypothetical protein
MKYVGIPESAFGFINDGKIMSRIGLAYSLRTILLWCIKPLSKGEGIPDPVDYVNYDCENISIVRITRSRLHMHVDPLMLFEIADALSVNIPLDTRAELS